MLLLSRVMCCPGDSPITLEEEALLRLYWQQNMKQLCSSLQPPLPSKVLVRVLA
jgi:hypothetical protein